MYSFSQDEKHLLFIDCFGLTRLSAPKKVKTDRKVSGSDSAGLATVSRDGQRAGSYEDTWDKSILWNFPELKSATRFDRFRHSGLVIHPEGSHYVCVQGGKLLLEPIAAQTVLLPLRLDAIEDEDEGEVQAKSVSVALAEGGETLPALVLGEGEGESEAKGHPASPAPLRIAHDGTLLYFDGRALICAELRGSKVTIRWRRDIRTVQNTRIEFHANRERCVIWIHHGRRWTVVERNNTTGKERSFEIESLGVPAVAGRYLAYQPSDKLVIRRDLDTDECSEHSLEVYDAKRKIDLRNEGVATLFVGAEGKLMALAGHRESLVDLIKGSEIPRKLPAKELDLRQAVLTICRPYCDAARLAGVTIEMARVEFNPKHTSASITHRIAGPKSLFGALLASHSSEAWSNHPLPDGWRMGSYGSHGGIESNSSMSAEELVEGYTGLAQVGIGFASTIPFWANAYNTSYGEPPSDPATLALISQMLLAVVRDGPQAKLDVRALAAKGRPSLDEVLAGFAHYAKRNDELPYNASQLAGTLYNRLFGADALRLWMYCMFEAEGFNGGSFYSDLDPYGIQPMIEAHPETAAPLRAWFASNPIPDDGRKWTLQAIRDRLGD